MASSSTTDCVKEAEFLSCDGVLSSEDTETTAGSPSAGAPDHPRDQRVDLRCVYNYFLTCIRENDQIDVDAYIKAYQELNRFFELLGKVFQFVASDVRSKLDIMESLRKSENSVYYDTIQSMVAHEKENDLLRRKDPLSGSRTLLRLHRALAFITDLLGRLAALDDNEKIVSHAQEAYKTTLAVHHPWLIQKAALMAMYTLPTRSCLLETTCQDQNVGSDILPQVVTITKQVYDITQQIYEVNDILDLP